MAPLTQNFYRAARARFGAEATLHQRRLRVVRAAGIFGLVLVLGTVGYYLLSGGQYSFLDCLYMTITVVSTVGFREIIPVQGSTANVIFTILLILFGVGTVLYFLTALTAMIVEGDLPHRFWRRQMEKRIQALRDHFIVVGSGRSGGQVVREFVQAGVPFVVIDHDPARIEVLTTEFHLDFPFILGDGLEDAILRAAGIERARGLVATLHEDRDNLFLSLTARQLNPKLRIAAKVDERTSFEKFEKVGVNAVVSPPVMGGRHLASEMMRPDVANFVDGLLRVTESAPALTEMRVAGQASVAGRSLGEADLRAHTNCLILGIRDEPDAFYTYNPGPDVALKPGSHVIALGDPVALERLRTLLQPSA